MILVTALPIRPNPLIATFVAICKSPFSILKMRFLPVFNDFSPQERPFSCGVNGKQRCNTLFTAAVDVKSLLRDLGSE
jgi:hypothetical protein